MIKRVSAIDPETGIAKLKVPGTRGRLFARMARLHRRPDGGYDEVFTSIGLHPCLVRTTLADGTVSEEVVTLPKTYVVPAQPAQH